jgi:rhodanese-related sulfurtransferase
MTTVNNKARRRFVASLALMALTGAQAQVLAPAPADRDSVSLDAARSLLESGAALVFDIREPQEHAGGVAPGMQLLPLRQMQGRIAEIPNDPARPVLLICRTQNRSAAALKLLREKGYTHVRYVQGGMSEWARRDWPLVKP